MEGNVARAEAGAGLPAKKKKAGGEDGGAAPSGTPAYRAVAWMLGLYLQGNASVKMHRKLAAWIKRGGKVMAYKVAGGALPGVAAGMAARLGRAGIAHVGTKDRATLYIRPDDRKKVEAINRKLLAERMGYSLQMPVDGMERAIAGAEKIKEKGILVAKGLRYYEAAFLADACEKMGPGTIVGASMDEEGHYAIAVHERNVYAAGPGKPDFCHAYLSSFLSVCGPNMSLAMDLVDREEDVYEAVDGVGEGEALYVMGQHDRTQYLEVTRGGFVHHSMRGEGGKLVDAKEEVGADDPDYAVKLRTAMELIPMKDAVKDKSLVDGHIHGLGPGRAYAWPKAPEGAAGRARAEAGFSRAADRMIKEHLAGRGAMGPEKAFRAYMKEAALLIQACAERRAPMGYDEGEVEGLLAIFEENGADPEAYAHIPALLRAASIEEREAGKGPRQDAAKEAHAAGKVQEGGR